MGRWVEGWRVRRLEGLLKTGKAKEKAFYLAEAAEIAEKDEIEYLNQNRRKICSDETTHPSGKVVR